MKLAATESHKTTLGSESWAYIYRCRFRFERSIIYCSFSIVFNLPNFV